MRRVVATSAQPRLQFFAGLVQGRPGARHRGQGIEQAEVVDHAVVAGDDDRDAGGVELAAVGLTLVAQHVLFRRHDQGRRQAAELVRRGLQR